MFSTMRLLYVLLLCAMGAQAGIYKWVDPEGRVHFSDHPVENAKELKSYDSNDLGRAAGDGSAPATAQKQADGESAGGYTAFELVQPEGNQTFRTDEGNVPVGMLLEPGLQKGHEIHLILDDSPVQGRFTNTQLTLTQAPRGTHRLRAVVVDAEGKILISSQDVSFHVRQGAKTVQGPDY